MNFAIIIPARYASSRFPGKPLAMLGGRPVIGHVIEALRPLGLTTIVATDDARIYRAVRECGGVPVMTRADHRCGTDRVREAADTLIAPRPDIIINVQGDEPFIHPDQVRALMEIFQKYPDTDIATLVRPLPSDTSYETLSDPALVKAVLADDGGALYFSRFPIPYQRGVDPQHWAEHHTYLAHVGIYAYRREVLQRITELPPSPLETSESLEQLRWLQAGLHIRAAFTTRATIGIDTPADLAAAEIFLKQNRPE